MLDPRSEVFRGPTIGYRCAKPTHLSAPSRLGRGGLTVHRREWAYCDGLDVDEDHEWEGTGGVEIEQLINWAQAGSARDLISLIDLELEHGAQR